MSRKTQLVVSFVLGFLILIGGLIGLLVYYERLPETLSQHETIVLGQSSLVPGSTAAMRVVVRDSRDATPLSDAEVEVRMRPADGGRAKVLFSGTTDASGNVDVAFAVPAVFPAAGNRVLCFVYVRQRQLNRLQQTLVARHGESFAQSNCRLAVRIKGGRVAFAIEVVKVPLERPFFLLHAQEPVDSLLEFLLV